jgi:hypothetical protein
MPKSWEIRRGGRNREEFFMNVTVFSIGLLLVLLFEDKFIHVLGVVIAGCRVRTED